MAKGLNLPKNVTFKGPAVLWKRMAAFVIDLIILDFVIGTPFRAIINRIIPSNDFQSSYAFFAANPNLTALLSIVVAFFGLLASLYFVILEFSLGQTVGKMLFNIKVESKEKELSFLSCMVRNMLFLFIFPFTLLWILDPLFVIFTKDSRRLSEILSRTRTVEDYHY